MENASKALTIAGGILIAILIIAALMTMFGSSSGMFRAEQDKKEIEQVVAFNNQYESYNKKLLRGTDVISVINKVIDNNKKYGVNGYNEPNYIMNVEFEMKEALVYTTDGISNDSSFKVGQKYDINSFSTIKSNQELFTDFKRRIFDCVSVKYNNTTGRVNYMLFVERKLTNNEYQNGIIYD